MNTMKKIGLITIYHVPNFGSVLQTYATQILLEKLGYECNIINYKYPNKWHHMQGTPKQSFKAFIGHLFGIKPAHRKANKLKEFKKEHFKFTRLYKDLDELKNADWSYYDMFVVGSDQVWKSQFTRGDSAFMLSFIPEEKPRISIASSFASKNISDAFKDKYRKYLRKFNAISVREKNGISIIKDELKIECTPEVLLDPTLLLSKEEWLETIPRSTFKKKKKYILLYMLTYAFEPRPYIFDILKHMQQQDDYDILALEGYTPKEDANGLEMIDKTDSSIPEFIDMFANADIVVTGEGCLDGQTVFGKAPIGVAGIAKKYDKTVIAFSGSVTEDATICNEYGIDAYFPILRKVQTLQEAMDSENAKENLAATVEQVFRLINIR